MGREGDEPIPTRSRETRCLHRKQKGFRGRLPKDPTCDRPPEKRPKTGLGPWSDHRLGHFEGPSSPGRGDRWGESEMKTYPRVRVRLDVCTESKRGSGDGSRRTQHVTEPPKPPGKRPKTGQGANSATKKMANKLPLPPPYTYCELSPKWSSYYPLGRSPRVH